MKYLLALTTAFTLLAACAPVEEEPIIAPPLPDDIGCTTEYQPVCGKIEVLCVTAPCDPVLRVFPNRCFAELSGATDIRDGICSDVIMKEEEDEEEADLISEFIRDSFFDKYPEVEEIEVTISLLEGNFARGMVKLDDQGAIFLAIIFGDNTWNIEFDGNGAIPCSLKEKGFPEVMLEDCSDS